MAGFLLLQGHMTMHFTMFLASFFVNSNDGVKEASTQQLKDVLEFERKGFISTRWMHFICGIVMLAAILLKNRGYFIIASFTKSAVMIGYIFFALYVRYLHNMNFMNGFVISEVSTWYQIEEQVFMLRIYALIVFLLMVNTLKLKSFWNSTIPDIVSPCGMFILPDFWSKRQASDILIHLKFEAFQFVFQLTFLIISIMTLNGYFMNKVINMSIGLSTDNIASVDYSATQKIGLAATVIQHSCVLVFMTKFLLDAAHLDRAKNVVAIPEVKTKFYISLGLTALFSQLIIVVTAINSYI